MDCCRKAWQKPVGTVRVDHDYRRGVMSERVGFSPDAVRRTQAAIREALARIHKASCARDLDLFSSSAAEASMWMLALDEHLRASDPTYEQRRDSDTGGQILRGLRWARNAAVHELVEIHDTRTGKTAPVPASFELASWCQRNSVCGQLTSQPKNEAAYDRYVAGEPVQVSLGRAQDFLWMRVIARAPGAEDMSWLLGKG